MSALRPLRLRVLAERTREGLRALWRLLGLLEAAGARLVRRLRFGLEVELPGDPREVRARLGRAIALL